MTLSEFRKEDYWLIKWPLISLTMSLCLSAGLLIWLNTLDTRATAELSQARNQLDSARQSVGKIEEEEATIIEYIGRYREMEQEGIVKEEDRLQFQETLSEVRQEFSLFPVQYNIESQTSLVLQYEPGREGGRDIILNTSLVEVSLPLLHEDDLIRLMAALVDGPGLVQPLTCSLIANANRTTYIFLAQHFRASCTMQWYTFRLPPESGGIE